MSMLCLQVVSGDCQIAVHAGLGKKMAETNTAGHGVQKSSPVKNRHFVCSTIHTDLDHNSIYSLHRIIMSLYLWFYF